MVLEHRYGALLLASLLAGDPVPELGDDAIPVAVQFQASTFSPVDDLVVVGQTPDNTERRVSIGVRRAPRLSPSDQASIGLLASYIRVVAEHWDEIQAGRWWLALAVASPNSAVQQLRGLASVAQGTSSEAEFRSAVATPRRTNQGVRNRLDSLDGLVEVAARDAAMDSHVSPSELTWRLLWALRTRELRLEDTDEADRTAVVARLRALTREGTPASADSLFTKLAELAGRYAPMGANVSHLLLRRDLAGTPLARSPSRTQAWTTLDGLSARLLLRTAFQLVTPQAELELARSEERDALAAEMAAVCVGPGVLVIHGEPDVGKSALALRAAEQLEAGGAVVTTLSIRDLPALAVDLESALGASLADVLGSTATGPTRLMLLDGAESVLEGRVSLLTEVAVAALSSGIGVAAVTRADGARAVVDALGAACTAAGVSAAPRLHDVPRLTETEVRQITETFPSLRGLTGDPRADWLLARPGWVDLLLRSGPTLDLPSGQLSEADLFGLVWQRLVRRDEEETTSSPDAREQALVAVARRLFLPGRQGGLPNADALPSLRSDGLLLPPGPTGAWNPGEEFASDLIRDLSVARLLVTEGWAVLDDTGAPRWALRAVRLAAQAILLRAATIEGALRELIESFDDIALQHGSRWEEVPLEATLTLGAAEEALSNVWPVLIDEHARLRTIMRLALQRYTSGGIGDPTVLGPLVKLAYCSDVDLGQDDRYGRQTLGEEIREVVLAWLRGLAMTGAGPLPLRQEVRDRLIARNPEAYDEFAIEALAMLGPDLNETVEALLRRFAEAREAFLAPAVETPGSVIAMSVNQPELLMALTESYYIDLPRSEEHGWLAGIHDDGIRRHQRTGGGFGSPMAAWYFGPFFRLLHARPTESLALINRMLDHAAAVRVGRLASWESPPPSEASEPLGLDLELPGVGTRRCVGDSHVWSWYRGSSVGPYACMSALLAVERFADHLVDTLGLPLGGVVERLLRDCHNLAMPGLVVGLVVRHFDRSADLLDQWLVRPELWHLEFSRAGSEGRLHVQGSDPPELVGRDRRRSNFRDVAAEMTLRAMLANDSARLAALASIGDRLVQRARDLAGDDEDELVAIQGWAAAFNPTNYHPRPTDDGGVVVEYEHPEDVATGLAPSMASLARGNDAFRLQFTYASSEDRVASVETLVEDLAVARELAANPPELGPPYPADAVAAVAAAAVIAHAQRRAGLSDEDLRWSAAVLVNAAMQPHIDEMSYEESTYPMGGDRSAAAALPALLLPVFDELALDTRAIDEALLRSGGSLFDEVREVFASGLAATWLAPCNRNRESGACRHDVAWAASREGLKECRLGDWDPAAQSRTRDLLPGPYEITLPAVDTDRLLVNRLTASVIAVSAAARSSSCVANDAGALQDVLLDTFRRGWGHWAREGYGEMNARWRAPVVRVLLEHAADGDTRHLTAYVREFTGNARALYQLLHDLAVLFTYDETLRRSLLDVWRPLMTTALDAVEDGTELETDDYRFADAVSRLLPTPQVELADTDPDATLARAEADWISPDEISDLFARWLPIALRQPESVDSVVKLARCAPAPWQAAVGMGWVEELIDGEYSAVARRCWFLIDWLEAVRGSGYLDADGTARWRRLVDGLASAGDHRAVRLQQAEE